MKMNTKTLLPSNNCIIFEKKSTYKVALKNVKCKENIAVVNRVFAADGDEGLDKIIEKWVKAINLNN